MKTLIVAEKPSMARAIAKALGSIRSENGYLVVGDYSVTNCIGHLMRSLPPEEMNQDWKDRKALPMIPEKLLREPNPATNGQYKIVKGLIESGDFSVVVNACDAGREGELIFHTVFQSCQTNGIQVKRLWISSLTEDSIRNGIAKMKDASFFDGLKAAAFLREYSDWIVGFNASRALSNIARSSDNKSFSLGRVQTPTLALMVKRDLEIENFRSKTYWQIQGIFSPESFGGWLVNSLEDLTVRSFENSDEAKAIEAQIKQITSAPKIVSLQKKEAKLKQPLLFDLTSLQKEMNKKFDFTAQKTLDLAQTLYEKKFLSYPRTSSAYLTQEDYASEVPKVLKSLEKLYPATLEKISEVGWALTKRHVDNSKVTDHYALIPTHQIPKLDDLSDDEKKVYESVAKRFLAAFYPEGLDERTTILIGLERFTFVSRGTVKKVLGWREIYEEVSEDETSDDNENSNLPVLTETSALQIEKVSALEKKTKSPARMNESSLLAAMETAGKIVDDEEMRQAMKDCGLGTPATRAAIIEKLIKIGYVERQKKQLVSTNKGREVIKLLFQLKLNLLTSAELTGNWEMHLQKVANNEFSPLVFKQKVQEITKSLVEKMSNQEQITIVSANTSPCPKCQIEKRSGFLKDFTKTEKPEGAKQIKKHFIVCSLGKEKCGYITNKPDNKNQFKKMVSSKCPKCKGVMTYRISSKGNPFLKCFNGAKVGCDGVLWFEPKKK